MKLEYGGCGLFDPYEVLKQAYSDWALEHPNKVYDDSDQLFAGAGSLYLLRRDLLLEHWAERTAQRVPAERLARLAYNVLDLLYKVDEHTALGFDTAGMSDDDNLPLTVAHALAILRWYNQCRAGRVHEELPLTLTEVRVWLHKHNFPVRAGQLSLFLDRQNYE